MGPPLLFADLAGMGAVLRVMVRIAGELLVTFSVVLGRSSAISSITHPARRCPAGSFHWPTILMAVLIAVGDRRVCDLEASQDSATGSLGSLKAAAR